jgi:gas vesicle protein
MFLKYITPTGDQITQNINHIVNVSAVKLNGSTLPNKFFVDAIANRQYEVTEESYLLNLPYILLTDKYKIEETITRVKTYIHEKSGFEGRTNAIKKSIRALDEEEYQTVWYLKKLSNCWLCGLFEISNEVEIKDDESEVAKKIIEDVHRRIGATEEDVSKMKNELNRLLEVMEKEITYQYTKILNM